MPDDRLHDGFTTLQDGVNGGISPDLILQTQAASATNITLREGFMRTRNPFSSRPLTFADDVTQTRFSGMFQGSCPYTSTYGWNGFVASVGGRMFTINADEDWLVSDVTPQLSIVTTLNFSPPAMSAMVTLSVNEDGAFSVNQVVLIDGGQYTVNEVATDAIVATLTGGTPAHDPVISGTPVLDSGSNQLIFFETNPATYDFIYLFQAEKYVIGLAGQNSPIIYDGASARLAGPSEIPPGDFGIYLWGRIWIAFPNRTNFVAGNLVYSDAAGTVAAILSFTDNNFLNGGGAFSVPQNAGPITGFAALANLDSSLGIGNLLVGCSNMVFSVNTPVDRDTWQNLSYPIQTISLLDYGPEGSRSMSTVNGDLWYRSTDGQRSFVTARRDMTVAGNFTSTSYGNTPQSREVSSILDADNSELLEYGSSTLFDNRLLNTCSPQRTPTGVIHQGLTVINLDLLSSMKTKLPPSWEGLYSGLDVYQILKLRLNRKERCFAFVKGGSGIELWEVNKAGYYDEFKTDTAITRTRISSVLETRRYDFQNLSDLKQLYGCELYLDQLVDNVSLTIKFRPDEYPNWQTWTTVNICADVSQCKIQLPGIGTCTVFKTRAQQYAARILLTKPPEDCNDLNGKPISSGYSFQFRIEGTGFYRLKRFKLHAIPASDATEGECQTETECKIIESCGVPLFGYDSHSGN